MQQQDALAIAQNGGTIGNASNDEDVGVDGDEDLDDDDMMDKISSSPSIEDGGYTLPPAWPRRVDSLRGSISLRRETPSSPSSSEARSSSPYLDTPVHPPLELCTRQASKAAVDITSCHHHLHGEYTGPVEDREIDDNRANDDSGNDDLYLEDPDDANVPPNSNLKASSIQRAERTREAIDQTIEHGQWHDNRDSRHRLELVDLSHTKTAGPSPIESKLEPDDDCDFIIPYEACSEDDDDDDDFPFTDDARFIDSGWGGECLQDTEDIDFDFVYALHTFVATVEGQANATKGDTMVLLDDSNSYWWLVRVAKDNSIGMVCHGIT